MGEGVFSTQLLYILIPTVTGAIITTLVPYLWKQQQHNFEIKIKIVEEYDASVRTHYNVFKELISNIRLKYYNMSNVKKGEFVWCRKEEPIKDVDLHSIYDKCRYSPKEIKNTSMNYMLLFTTDKIDKIFEERKDILTKIHFNLNRMYYNSEKIDLDVVINETDDLLEQLIDYQGKILQSYFDSLKMATKIKNFFQRKK